MASPKTRPTDFDLATFEKMTEPVTIRIARVDRATGGKTPLSLPQVEWSKADAKRIEDIVLKDIAGGGVYEAEMNGANSVGFKWKFMFPENLFPPMFTGGPVPHQGPAPAPGAAPPGTAWTVAPYAGVAGQPIYMSQAPAPAAYQAPQQQRGSTPMQYPYMYGYSPSTFGSANGASTKEDSLRAEVEAMKQRALDSEHRREREAAETRHATEMAELRRAIQESNAAPKQDSQLEALKLQMAADRERHERERQEAREAREEQRRQEDIRRQEALVQRQEEQRRQDDQRREELRLLEERRRSDEENRRRDEDARRQIEEARRMAEQTQREASERRFELMIQMMQAQQANNPMTSMLADVTRQLADSQREASLRAAEAPMKSMEMARMFKDMSGSDHLMKNIADAYNSAHGISMRGLEMVSTFMQSQQGSPGWELLGQGIQGAKEAFTDFVTSSKKAEMAQARAAQAQAQERTMAHQAQVAYAQAQTMAQQAAQNPAMQEQAEQARLTAEQAASQAAGAAQAAAGAAQEATAAADAKEEKEMELFGIAWPEVQKIRVMIKTEGETEKMGNIIALGVCMATVQLAEQKISIPAFDLIRDKRTFDLIELLVPGVSGEFVGHCAQIVDTVLAQGPEALQALHDEVTGDDDDDGDDGDQDGDDEEG